MRLSAHCRVLELALLATCSSLPGAQLPLRHYTTADGLANNRVYSIASDSRGFLWFATAEGLSRFDGYGFANQTENTGLPHGGVGQVLIDRHGNYWLAMSVGLVRFRPDLPQSSRDRMIVIRPGGKPESAHISALLEDRIGTLWCGTDAGLYSLDDTASRTPRLAEVPIGLPGVAWGDSAVSGLAEDTEGALWIGMADGTLYRRPTDLRVERYPSTEKPPRGQITHLLADRKGRIWVGRENGLYRSAPAPRPGGNGFEPLYGKNDGLPRARVFDMFESREGDVWVGMYRCLAQFPADGDPVRLWTKDNGLPSRGALSLGQDRDGNLWLGTEDLGAFRLAAGGTLTYSTEDGIGMDAVISVAETLRGELYIAGRQQTGGFRIGVRSGDGFHAIEPRVPRRIYDFGWRSGRVILQDHAGEWWLASYQGLCRYPRLESPSQLAQTSPKAVYTKRDGLPANEVIGLYEDSGGNIWVSVDTGKFACWSRSVQGFIRFADTVPAWASAFGEDIAGHVWIGDDAGQLWRVKDGRVSRVASLATRALIRGFLLDHAGRLWVATGGQGLLRFDQPAGPNPQFRQYGYADGLSSVNLHSLAEDRNGAIYVGTGGGVDRLDLDPDLAHIRHYTPADGIAPGQVHAAYRDGTGAIWFATSHGLTRLVPQNGLAGDPPPVWITGLSIAGRRAPVSEAGESSIRQVEVQPGQEQIQFDFVGLSYSPGNILRYQYRLGDHAWSAPIESRSVHYGALAPGRYRFAVRAINSDGEASPAPATVEFRVSPSLWRRAWFQGILLAVALAGAVWVHRARVARLLEIERVRSNIALDLHDDIASNLSQITIFSEIAMREAGPDSRAGASLARIAETARETVESISDIVWSIRPQKEGDLWQRIRRFGSDALTSRQIGVVFHMSEEIQHLTLEPNARRQVYLIYKEALHNTVRHAQATAVEISMNVVEGDLVLKIGDNGKGMASREEGNGLPGMRGRALSLGGRLAIHSAAGEGTEVELRAPLKRKWRGGILPR
jgi:ligand-binding sensor domain-containing protein/signal transduction histidine kinase